MNATVPPHPAEPRSPRAFLPAALGSRTQVAVAVIAGFAVVAWADAVGLGGARPGWWLVLVAVVVAVRGAGEFVTLFGTHGVSLRRALVPMVTAALPLAAALGNAAVPSGVASGGAGPAVASLVALGWTAAAAAIGVACLLGAEVMRYPADARPLDRAALGCLAMAALGLPLAALVGLRIVGGSVGPDRAWPLVLVPLVSLVAAVKGGDIAAYLIGSTFGRHRMAPTLSPGKTWEGAVASMVASVTVSWLVISGLSVAGVQPWGGWLVFGLAVGGLGMLGDLAESLVKREVGAKDSGSALGGMGGALDLVDSLLFAAPAAWVLWVLGGLRGG
jgi:phosphatidate cytidylyltransferase